MTIKKMWGNIRRRQLLAFRRFVRLEGSGEGIVEFMDLNAWEFREYIESQWQPGMNWDNYNYHWVIDHIVALKYFNPTSAKDMKICWNHNNLKPNFYWDNHAKGYCVEVTVKSLESLKDNPMKQVLLKHIESYTDMFAPYYKETA